LTSHVGVVRKSIENYIIANGDMKLYARKDDINSINNNLNNYLKTNDFTSYKASLPVYAIQDEVKQNYLTKNDFSSYKTSLPVYAIQDQVKNIYSTKTDLENVNKTIIIANQLINDLKNSIDKLNANSATKKDILDLTTNATQSSVNLTSLNKTILSFETNLTNMFNTIESIKKIIDSYKTEVSITYATQAQLKSNTEMLGQQIKALQNRASLILDTLTIQSNLTVNGTTTMNGQLNTPNGHNISSTGRQHISGAERLYLLNKSGVIVGKEGGGNGNLSVQGAVITGDAEQPGWTGVNMKRRDGRWTHFDWVSDQRNHINGDTIINGTTSLNGNTNVQKNLSVNENLCISDVCIAKNDLAKMKALQTVQGPQGPQGGQGPQGPQGHQGPQGASGATMPDDVTIRRHLRVKGDAVFNGGNNWIMHTPDDGRHHLYVAPSGTAGNEDWNWAVQTRFDPDGTVNVKKLGIENNIFLKAGGDGWYNGITRNNDLVITNVAERLHNSDKPINGIVLAPWDGVGGLRAHGGGVDVGGTLRTNVLQIGNKWRLAEADAHTSDFWLRLHNAQDGLNATGMDNYKLKSGAAGTGQPGGIAAGQFWSGSGSYHSGSDIRIKDNVKYISPNEISNLDKLKPVKYNLKSDSEKKLHYGLVAQDIEKIYPNLVMDGPDGIKSVNYQGLTPIIINKLQSMNNQIDTQKVCINGQCVTENDILFLKKLRSMSTDKI
jgi:hypothetical protein